jgi:hypothetical protein
MRPNLAAAIIPTGAERTRTERAIRAAVSTMKLDLSGVRVLTEAASGSFAVTSIAAALAGADTIAVTRDSAYGAADKVKAAIESWARDLGLEGKLSVQIGRPDLSRGPIDLVTNLGFVRPIDRSILSAISPAGAVSLMWEPWEARADDIDYRAARELGIPIVGTRETHPEVRTFDYLGLLAAKLLFEARCPILGATVGVIGSDPFGSVVRKSLASLGATVFGYDPASAAQSITEWYESIGFAPEFIVVVEHRDHRILIGEAPALSARRLLNDGVGVIHICGGIDIPLLKVTKLQLHPAQPAPTGRMSVTTDYVGVLPVIKLHVAGLRVGEIVVRSRRTGLTPQQAIGAAVDSGLGVSMSDTMFADHAHHGATS